MPLKLRHGAIACWILVFGCAYGYLRWRFGMIFFDDAYITMSHAASWVTGGAPVMSQHNPVCGTSTPLYTMVLAAASWLFGTGPERMEQEVAGINLVAELAVFALVYRIAGLLGLQTVWRLCAVSACGLSLLFIVMASTGMEAMLYAAIVLAGIAGMLDERPLIRWRVLPAFLAALVRPEGVLLGIVMVLQGIISRRRKREIGAVAAAAVCGFAAFSAFYFYSCGILLPQSVIAKSAQFHYGFGETLHNWFDNLLLKGPVIGGRRTTAILVLSLIGLTAVMMIRGGLWRRCLPCILWAGAYIGFFFLSSSSNPYTFWYYFPPLPALVLVTTTAAAQIFGRHERAAWIVSLLFILVATAGILRQDLPAKYRTAYDDREARYKQVAAFLNKAAVPGEQLYYSDVGVLGFYTRLTILDYHGLISPEVVPFIRATGMSQRYYDTLVSHFAPRWIITRRLAGEPPKDTFPAGIVPLYRYIHSADFPGSIHTDMIELRRRL